MVSTVPSWIPHVLGEHLLCTTAAEMETQGKRATLKAFVLCSFQVADRIFVVSVQVCQFALAYHPPGYQENVPEGKHQSVFVVIRFVSWAWISSFEWHSWGRNRPASQQSTQESSPLPGQALPYLRCRASALTASWSGWQSHGAEAPHSCGSVLPWRLYQIPTSCKGKKRIWQQLCMNLSIHKKQKLRLKKKGKLVYSALLWTFYIIWFLKEILITWHAQ